MSEATIRLVMKIVARFAGLGPMLAEHKLDNDGEILPHLFFGDLTRYVVSLLDMNGPSALQGRHELRAILDDLEERYVSGGEDVKELISVSFLENLPQPGTEGSQIREMVGPGLRRQLDVIDSWMPS